MKLKGGHRAVFNKKGEGNDANIPAVMLYYMMASIILVMIIFGFASIVSNWQIQAAHYPDEIKAEAIAMRFTQNPDCFAFEQEKSGKVYSGIIDLSKFNQKRMDECYFTGENGKEHFQFELYLEEYDKKVLSDHKYVNIIDNTIKKKVLVYDEGKLIPSTLFIYVQEKV